MDKLVVYHLLTLGFFFYFIISEIAYFLRQRKPLMSRGEILWNLHAVRTGTVKFGFRHFLLTAGKNRENEIPLEEGTYLVGNRRGDDIYLDSTGRKVQLFVDVRHQCVYLTVMKGAVSIAGIKYQADSGKRLEIQEHMRIRAGNVDLIFKKERWR